MLNRMSSRSSNEESIDFLIPEEDSGKQDFRERRLWRKKFRWTPSRYIVAGAALSSLLWIAAWSYQFSFHTVSARIGAPEQTLHCGSNPTEARNLACKFQLWSFSWVPTECFDEALQDDFLELHAKEKWSYFSDLDTLEEVPLELVLAGDRNDLFSTWGQHFWHCAFYQRKFFRVESGAAGSGQMTNRDRDEHHALHCQMSLADPLRYEWDRVNINLTVGYHQCN